MAWAWQVNVQPHETLFRVGDSSEAGIFIVVEGRLGVFLQVPAMPHLLAQSAACSRCCCMAAHGSGACIEGSSQGSYVSPDGDCHRRV